MTNNDLDKKILVQQCQKIEFLRLIKKAKEELKNTILKGVVNINGTEIKTTTSLTGNGGRRGWFQCPICQARCGVLYQHPFLNKLGCRKCLNLIYRSQAEREIELEKPNNKSKI